MIVVLSRPGGGAGRVSTLKRCVVVLPGFAVLAWVLFGGEAGAALVVLDGARSPVTVQDRLEWFTGDDGTLDIRALTGGRAAFRPAPPRAVYPRRAAPYWFRLRLTARAETAAWWLELAYTQLDHIDLYHRVGAGPWSHQVAGDRHPHADLAWRHPYPAFRLPLRAGAVTEVLLRVQSSTSIMVPLSLWREDALARHTQDRVLVNGLAYGVLVALMLYNLFLFPTTRDAAYLWFALYLASFTAFQFSLDGFGSLYLWPQWPALADRAATLALWLCMAAGLRFTRRMGRMHRYAPRMDRLFRWLSNLALVLALAVALLGPAPVFGILPVMGLVVVLLIPLPLWAAWRAGYRPARYALLAYLPLLPGTVWLAARAMAWLEPSFWSEHLFIIGAALSSILLSFALADRINVMREERAAVRGRLLRAERAASRARQRFSRQLIEAQDGERRRLAAELHDGVGQTLSFLTNALRRLRRGDGAAVPASLEAAAREAVEEVRALSHRLHPSILDKLGWAAAIEAIAERTEAQTGIVCLVQLDEDSGALPPGADLHVYRVAQEALNNAQRHSGARRIELALRRRGMEWVFSVTDDGRGRGPSPAAGLGLASIAERATLLGGKARFENVVPHGFRVMLTFPAVAP